MLIIILNIVLGKTIPLPVWRSSGTLDTQSITTVGIPHVQMNREGVYPQQVEMSDLSDESDEQPWFISPIHSVEGF